jgi:type III restriction enzyme
MTPTAFTPKGYQQRVLETLEMYFEACHALPTPAVAFGAVTERLWGRPSVYRALAGGFDADMPYFCLRVPTGGGKTWLAARSIALVNAQLLRSEHSVVLWLVPSKPIREQTLRALRDLRHPYHAALREAGPVAVMDLDEALSLTRATLDTATVVIVATRQAFQVEDEECRKVYQSSGALMHHFDTLAPTQRAMLLADADGTRPCSLANVLRLRRPFVIVDEAHNSRTDLGFEMLARLAPSGVMELTATPDTERVPSNVLHSVSAAELKAEEMIKLPVLLQTEPDWQQCIADAVARRNALQGIADDERRHGAPYLRPVVLIQAEARRTGVETLDVEQVRRELSQNQRIPSEEIAIATGDERGLERIDANFELGIADPACPVKFVITQRALAEGWDCPFAYILLSMSALHSATAVEQLIGRVLRQPNARHFRDAALNRSYAFVVSRHFAETAHALRERLVQGAGFERKAAAEFVAAARSQDACLDLERGDVVMQPVSVALAEAPDLKALPRSLRDKIQWNSAGRTLVIAAPLDADEGTALAASVRSVEASGAIVQAALASRTAAIEHFQTPAERGEPLRVPQLALRRQGLLELFDDPQSLDEQWDLSPYDASPSADDLAALGLALKASEGGEIDVDGGTGKVVTRFLPELQRDLGLAYRPEHWNEVRLAAWLARNMPAVTLTHASKQAFIAAWLTALLARPGYDLARANLQKFAIRQLIERHIERLKRAGAARAVQQALFDEPTRIAAVDGSLVFEYAPGAYAPSRDYDDRFGQHRFRHHYYGRMGDFDSREEFECAVWLDMQAQKGRIKTWVRNLVRREGCSFYLQKANGRFYPDFVCLLADGTVLAVEYKGADRWTDAHDDRLIGGLWAELSKGRCRFVMVKDRQWHSIDALLGPTA